MKREHNLALKITFFVTFLIILSVFLSSFFFSNFNSIFDFLENVWKEFSKNPSRFYNAFFALIIVFFGTYTLIYFFWKKHFSKIDEYNKNLKDYNHYLAHELKTPISVIFSNLEVLKYWFDEEIIKNSQKELKNIIAIIDVLLSFAENVNIAEREEFNLENFLKAYIKDKFKPKTSNIFIENNELNFYVETNKVLFKRIVRNLLDNALKYSSDWNVFLKIEDKKLFFINNLENEISEKEIEKLLSKFYRKNNSSKNGYGLGLALIKEIFKFLWFWFKVYSSEKKFFVEIDFAEKKERNV